MSVKPRTGVENIKGFIPGKSKAALEKEQGEGAIIRLGTNENRLGPSPKVLEALNGKDVDYAQYQDTNNPFLRDAISKYHNIPEDQILFGNGLFEVTLLIAQAYLDAGDKVIIPNLTFGWYARAVSHTRAEVVGTPVKDDLNVDTDAILHAVDEKTKAIFLCNPNNPTGKAIPKDELINFIEKVPSHVLLVIDEAYVDYAVDYNVDLVPLIAKHDNLVILRTFSKLYGLASFRVGYALGSREVIETIGKVKPPLNLGTPAELAALAAIQDGAHRDAVRRINRSELENFYRTFEDWGYETVRSEGNFFLVKLGDQSKEAVELLEKRRILIRDGERFGLKGYVRITVGTPEDNRALIDALKEILNK